jgi:aspartyl-tRNA(Asn)/glutamyl-tRNA(Gln) amidotransferase subunit A
MSADDAIAYASIAELGRRYRAKEVSPVEVVGALLARIERLDGTLHAFVTLTRERALAEARAAETALQRGDAGSPLLGVPMGYKDIYCTRGVRTTGGSALLADWVPDVDATTVTKLQAAGSVMMGKLITHEFAMGIQFPGHRFPAAANPWNVQHMPGGSSSGSCPAMACSIRAQSSTVRAMGPVWSSVHESESTPARLHRP